MKILIIGGSIVGLCVGIALIEIGFDVEIYERAQGTLKVFSLLQILFRL
jgi:2-polyprenyl-6-methoxyphenol hydroxylase-like FAD-dependent oxidoreductase